MVMMVAVAVLEEVVVEVVEVVLVFEQYFSSREEKDTKTGQEKVERWIEEVPCE